MINKQIILFDGVCNLCNKAVTFIIKRDEKNIFLFSSLQSETGKLLLKKHQLKEIDSIVLIKNKKAYIKSEAVFEIIKELKGFWCFLKVFRVLPLSFRDYLYTKLAKNRYRLFGKKESCINLTDEMKEKFI